MTASSAWAIETVDLVKRFQSQRRWRAPLTRGQPKVALDGVTLQVAPGEIFGLLGPNGAGKTTLVKILSTLILPTTGRAFVGGLDVAERSLAVRRRIGVVYGDERTFFWRLSAAENLRFYAALYHIPPARAEHRARELLELVGLERAADVRMQHFSSGMKQRVAVARGLLSDPDILFMDEPTHNLDPIAARELRDLVRERVLDGRRTVLLATNIMVEAEDLCHRVAFLSQGRIQLLGSIEQLRDRLQAEEVHQLVVSRMGRDALEALWRVPGVRSLEVLPVIPSEDGACRLDVAVQRGSPAVPLIIRQVVEEGGHVWSSTPRALSLEEMFAITVDGSRRHREGSTNGQPRLAEAGSGSR